MAALVVAYTTLRHQERQDHINYRLQVAVGLVAFATLLASIAAVLRH